MNQQYHWNTLYPVNRVIPPLAVKLVFDEHTHAAASRRGAAPDHYLDTTQGEPALFVLADDPILLC